MSAPFVAMSGSAVFPTHRVPISSSSSRRRCAACFSRQSFPSISIRPAPPKRLLNLACSAKQDTIGKVCGIVKKQMAVAQDTLVNGVTKFADLGADSLDTRIKEIVCSLAETQHGVDLVGSVSLESPRPVKKRSTAPPSSKPPTYTTLSIRSTSDGSLLLPHDFLARYGPVIHPEATFSGTIIGLLPTSYHF
ncbi:hypothetical protein ZWY2020_035647 [Hordeum vulgare]|nr:hypothetical protein ZWY2020_035647 [Hordeum vulgare]